MKYNKRLNKVAVNGGKGVFTAALKVEKQSFEQKVNGFERNIKYFSQDIKARLMICGKERYLRKNIIGVFALFGTIGGIIRNKRSVLFGIKAGLFG